MWDNEGMSEYMQGRSARRAGIPAALLEGVLVQDNPSATLQKEVSNPPKPGQKISVEEQDSMLREAAAHGSISTVEDKYGVARGYLRSAMKRRFGSLEAMKQVLLGLVTENAITVQMIAAEKAGELTAGQAVFAGKLLVDTMEKIENSIKNTPKTVNFGQLEKVGETIAALRKIVDAPYKEMEK